MDNETKSLPKASLPSSGIDPNVLWGDMEDSEDDEKGVLDRDKVQHVAPTTGTTKSQDEWQVCLSHSQRRRKRQESSRSRQKSHPVHRRRRRRKRKENRAIGTCRIPVLNNENHDVLPVLDRGGTLSSVAPPPGSLELSRDGGAVGPLPLGPKASETTR